MVNAGAGVYHRPVRLPKNSRRDTVGFIMSDFAFGDLVVLVVERGAKSLGMIAELRRADCRVQFLREGRSVWAQLRDLRPARAEEMAGSVEQTTNLLLRLLGAVEMEFTMPESTRCRLVAIHGAILPDTVDAVRAMLDARLLSFVIAPQGMHRIRSVIEFRC
jgi:hypothetical protein